MYKVYETFRPTHKGDLLELSNRPYKWASPSHALSNKDPGTWFTGQPQETLHDCSAIRYTQKPAPILEARLIAHVPGTAIENGATMAPWSLRNHRRRISASHLGPVPVATYYLRVRAIDASGGTVATSPSTSFSVSCQSPISPENVRLDRVSEDRVRISWTFPSEDPACQTYFFISGMQNGVPVSHRVPGSERSYDIEGPARGDWRVEVRAVNSAGSGPASQQAVFTSAQQFRKHQRHRRSVCDPRTDFWCRSDSQQSSAYQYLEVGGGSVPH
ncbi:fibronectin type III domain protein [Ostertagia ostertagi]